MATKRPASAALETNTENNTENSTDSVPSKISTFVFLDLETSALYTYDKPKIMEISMVAVHRRALCQGTSHSIPRVLDKVTVCFNPNKQVSPKSFELTGLDNLNIVESGKQIFDEDAVKLMQLFLRRQEQPVCLVAHNGNRFDFRLLRSELRKINQNLGDILCADSIDGCYNVDEMEKQGNNDKLPEDQNVTPVKQPKLNGTPPRTPSKFPRMMPYNSSTQSYALANVYKRIFGHDLIKAHTAEGDVMSLIQICKSYGDKMCQWMDKNARKFNDVELYYMPSPPRSACQKSLQY